MQTKHAKDVAIGRRLTSRWDYLGNFKDSVIEDEEFDDA